MRIEEYLDTLPANVLSGEDVQLSEKSLREIFKFVNLGESDVFYHLGCGDENGAKIAAEEFNARRATGIDNNFEKIKRAKENVSAESSQEERIRMICCDIEDADISDATVILFWFTKEDTISRMVKKFESLNPGTRVITIWGPLPDCIPDSVRFPYIINRVPFKKASSMQEQILSVFGVKCIDFVTAWEFAERYTKSIGSPEVKNDRFLTIIQTLVIWINAKNLGVACGDDIPESIQTYISIMKMHFDIDFEHMLKK